MADEPGRIVATAYSKQAQDYEELWAPVLLPYSGRLLDRLSLAHAKRVLEIGAGVGRLLLEIRDRAPRADVFGTDIAEGMLARAPGDFPRAVMDAVRLGFADDSFDAVVMVFMLFHLPEPAAGLREAGRVLRPGGVTGVATWGDGASFPALDVWDEVLEEFGADDDPAAGDDSSDLTNTPEKMQELCRQARLADVESDQVAFEKRWDLESFLEFRTNVGSGPRRLGTIDPDRRRACIAAARERLGRLTPEEFVDHDFVVLAKGMKP